MISGARQGVLSGFNRLVAAALARDLGVFVVPGPDIARAHGLDIGAAGLHLVASPRHASVLLIIGDITPALREAAAVVYAQMMRPRALLAVGTGALSPLPAADISTGISQQELLEGVHQLRTAFTTGAFQPEVSDFDAPVLQIRIEYTCPMHPEIVQDEPGSCPKCGMFLVPREVQAGMPRTHSDNHADRQITSPHTHKTSPEMDLGAAVEYTCPMHPEVVQNEPGQCPKCGMNLEPRKEQPEQSAHEHHHTDHSALVEYTCPMHPEVVQNEPGQCPKCGMNLQPRKEQPEQPAHEHHHTDHNDMDHSHMNHDDMDFMSMIEVTKDLPRSGDGLPMEWIDAAFGPFFPGLPGGLLLSLTLDGDTVAGSSARSLAKAGDPLAHAPMDTAQFVEFMSGIDPLAPVAYRLLACRALENAAGVELSAEAARARIGALERERIASHLNWLTLFGQQTGFDWLQQHAAALQLNIRQANLEQLVALKPAMQSLIKRLRHTPLLKSRTARIGRVMHDTSLLGPVARAAGINSDARSADAAYITQGFSPVCRQEGDAYARLQVRLEEISHSLALLQTADAIELPVFATVRGMSGGGEAVVETPRGQASLQLTLKQGQVTAIQLTTPSTHHLTLIPTLTEQLELGDALVTVGSLDLSPWEVWQ